MDASTLPKINFLLTCDRCGVAGKTMIILPSGLDLIFCGHHAHEHGSAHLPPGTQVHELV